MDFDQFIELLNEIEDTEGETKTTKLLREKIYELGEGDYCKKCGNEMNHIITCKTPPYQDGYSVCTSCGWRAN